MVITSSTTVSVSPSFFVSPIAQAPSGPKIEEVKISSTPGQGADTTPTVSITIKVSGLKADEKYSIYLGDTSRAVGDKVNPGKTEWIQGENPKEFTGAELAKGVTLTGWSGKGPKYITVANFDEVVVAASKKVRVE